MDCAEVISRIMSEEQSAQRYCPSARGTAFEATGARQRSQRGRCCTHVEQNWRCAGVGSNSSKVYQTPTIGWRQAAQRGAERKHEVQSSVILPLDAAATGASATGTPQRAQRGRLAKHEAQTTSALSKR